MRPLVGKTAVWWSEMDRMRKAAFGHLKTTVPLLSPMLVMLLFAMALNNACRVSMLSKKFAHASIFRALRIGSRQPSDGLKSAHSSPVIEQSFQTENAGCGIAGS